MFSDTCKLLSRLTATQSIVQPEHQNYSCKLQTRLSTMKVKLKVFKCSFLINCHSIIRYKWPNYKDVKLSTRLSVIKDKIVKLKILVPNCSWIFFVRQGVSRKVSYYLRLRIFALRKAIANYVMVVFGDFSLLRGGEEITNVFVLCTFWKFHNVQKACSKYSCYYLIYVCFRELRMAY